MKAINFLIAFVFLTGTLIAQAPQRISYQTVVRNASNNLIINSAIGLKLSVVQGDINGPVAYSETHSSTSNNNGLLNVELGAGTVIGGSFPGIDWSNGPWFIRTETDLTGGNNYEFSGAQQLLSVPYAFYTNTADSLAGGYDETDPVFSGTVAAGITASDTAYWNQKQDALIAGPGIEILGDTIRSSLHEIGELYGGGIVVSVWIEDGQQHGLIASLADLGVANWSNLGNTVIGATAQDRYDGVSNTLAITGQAGHVNSAALLCQNYSAGGYTDWYLPALWELDQFNRAFFHVQTVTGSNLFLTNYWSSTESELPYQPWIVTRDAYMMVMGYGDFANSQKQSFFNVRAFRRF